MQKGVKNPAQEENNSLKYQKICEVLQSILRLILETKRSRILKHLVHLKKSSP